MRLSIKMISAALLVSAAAWAGSVQQFQIGGPNGLTSAYLSNPNANGCVTNCLASTTAYNGTSGNWQYRSYQNSMFESSTSITGQSQNLPNLTGSTTSAASITDGNITDSNGNGVTFDLINGGGSTNALNNIWSSIGSGTTGSGAAINIPIGIFGVDQLWTVLNDYYGFTGQTLSIQFNFSATSSNDASATGPSVTLTEGTVYTGSTTGGNLRSAMDCTGSTGSGSPCPALTTGNGDGGAFKNLTVPAGTPITGGCTLPNTLFGSGANAISVCDSTLWSAAYNNPTSNSPFHNANGNAAPGNVMLDDQDFVFGSAYANDFLVSMTITTQNGNLQNDSRMGLSAVTVEGSTPEPATLSLVFLGGLGMVWLARFRRRRS